MPRVLHVGCGTKRKDRTIRPFASPDWEEVTLDINEAVRPDIVDRLPELAKAPSCSFDALCLSARLNAAAYDDDEPPARHSRLPEWRFRSIYEAHQNDRMCG